MPRRLVLLATLAALGTTSAACGHDSTIARALRNRSVKGRYVYAGEGRTVTIPWRFDASLTLDGRGKYALDLDVRVRGEGDRSTSYGTYAVEDDRLVLTSSRSRGETHELVVRGDSLIAETDLGGSVILRVAGIPKPVFVRQR